MPEGDTIHRTAAALDRVLAGKELLRFDAPRLVHEPFPTGTIVVGAHALGKHCGVHFDDGRTLHTHLGMSGSWHLYRPGERWQQKPAAMRARIEVADRVAVCFAAPTVELVAHGATAGAGTGQLGPDLCRPDADIERAAMLLVERSPPGREIGDALLDQRIASGIGNIWKSEALFAAGIDPFAAVGDLTGAERLAVLATAARLLREQVSVPTVARQVYGRRGRPCRRCGTAIRWRAQGEHRRGTYWCPVCQVSP